MWGTTYVFLFKFILHDPLSDPHCADRRTFCIGFDAFLAFILQKCLWAFYVLLRMLLEDFIFYLNVVNFWTKRFSLQSRRVRAEALLKALVRSLQGNVTERIEPTPCFSPCYLINTLHYRPLRYRALLLNIRTMEAYPLSY